MVEGKSGHEIPQTIANRLKGDSNPLPDMEIFTGTTRATVVFDGSTAYCRIQRDGCEPAGKVFKGQTRDAVVDAALTLIFTKG